MYRDFILLKITLFFSYLKIKMEISIAFYLLDFDINRDRNDIIFVFQIFLDQIVIRSFYLELKEGFLILRSPVKFLFLHKVIFNQQENWNFKIKLKWSLNVEFFYLISLKSSLSKL